MMEHQLRLEAFQSLCESASSQYMSKLKPCVIPLRMREQLQSEMNEKPATEVTGCFYRKTNSAVTAKVI